MFPADLAATRDYGRPPPLDHAPMLWIAIAASFGIILDYQFVLPFGFVVVAGFVCTTAWWFFRKADARYALGMLLCGVAALAACYHGIRDRGRADDDISLRLLTNVSTLRVRGQIAAELAASVRSSEEEELIGRPGEPHTRSVIAVQSYCVDDTWKQCSGRLRMVMVGLQSDLHTGDHVECTGRFILPEPARNPGENDERVQFARRDLRGTLVLRDPVHQLTRLHRGWPDSLDGILGYLRSRANKALMRLGPDIQPLASALLLGDGSGLGSESWQRYMRTGIVHVLAVSGQHLMVLAFFLQIVLRPTGISPRRGLILTAAVLFFYALLTGGRPPVMRAAIMCCIYCLSRLLSRSPSITNSFASAWVVVLVLDPRDILDAGCQLSFLSVAVLFWVIFPWLNDPHGEGPWWLFRPLDPLDRLIEAAKPRRERVGLWLLRATMRAYATTIIIPIFILPIIVYRYHLLPLSGLLISPFVVLLASIALVLGFLMLLITPLAWVFAIPVRGLLLLSEALIGIADRVPGASWYVADWPLWWVVGFYAVLVLGIWLPRLMHRLRAVTFAGLGWCALGLLMGAIRPGVDELRATFLSVGHGCCVVLEIPGGHTVLYDAGSMLGAQVVRQKIAPFLWSRGITRIDEVLISHGDLDHCNALPALLERFAVGTVSFTPTFSEKATPAITTILAKLREDNVATRILSEGRNLALGELSMQVLHPPAATIPGNENARSLVLLLKHAGHRILLTGDLEGAGLDHVLKLPPLPVDVMMAPHHGSNTSNRNELAAWARPRIVISCQGTPRQSQQYAKIYAKVGAESYDTWQHGAVTVRSHARGLHIETFLYSRAGLEFATGE